MNLQLIKNLIGQKKVKILLVILMIGIYILGTYFIYDEYRDTIIAKEQESMLDICRSISRSIELFIDDTVDGIEAIVKDRGFIEGVSQPYKKFNRTKILEEFEAYYKSRDEIINGVYFIDNSGKGLIKYPRDAKNMHEQNQDDIGSALQKKSTHIGRAYLDEELSVFILNIYEPVFNGEEFKGLVAVSLSLDVIYNILIDPVKIGKKGYAMVKDEKGIIIMHPVKEQVGMDVIETRKKVFPELEYQELEKLIQKQLTGEEGTEIYHSYWWGDNVLKKAKKLNAYTPVKFGEYFWVVALTNSYDEIATPINKFLLKILSTSIIVAIVIFMFLSAFLNMRKNKEKLEKETNYLKMLNESSEQLRKKEAELYHSHKLKMIGTLAGGIAHDINNLLTPILGYSELLLMKLPEGSEDYEDVEEIIKATQKGKELLQQMLVFSRSDSNVINIESIDMIQLIRETVKMLKILIPKNITIEGKIEEKACMIKANYTQIHQVIFNLCMNAYQAIGSKKGVISIEINNITGAEASGISKKLYVYNEYIELIVKDSGCGMDEETKSRIFEPFFTTKTMGDGTGLGLFVVQSIVDKYGGEIMVESTIGEGTTFKIYLPLTMESINEGEISQVILTDNGIKRILIIDDNDKILKVLKKGLHSFGYKVVCQNDPNRALKIFKEDHNKFDLVITDFMMPNMKGNELAKKIKSIRKDIPIILMTGYIDNTFEEQEDKENMIGFISKPIEFTELEKMIKKL